MNVGGRKFAWFSANAARNEAREISKTKFATENVFIGLPRIDQGVFVSVSAIEHNTLVKYFLDTFPQKICGKVSSIEPY
jgi:hypothetical protein